VSRAGTSQYTAEQGGALFTGLPVAQTAGLRLKPGSPTTVFDDDRWDLSGLADAPVVMSAHRKILDFTMITNPRWRWVAREYLMARLAPRHPAVATLPRAFRTPINPHSLWADLHLLADWFNYLTSLGISYLEDVAQHHCQAYLAVASRRNADPDRRLSPSTITARIRITQVLALYSEILTDSYRPGFTPWAGRSADDVAGNIRTAGNSVPPVPDTLLRPLLANCLYLLETVGPHLAVEASAARAADQREAASRRYLPQSEVGMLRHVIEDRRSAGIAAPRMADTALARRLGVGWDPADPLLHMAWHPIVVAAAGAIGERRDLETLRPELEKWVRQCGIAQPWCRDAALIARHDTGQLVPWAVPMSRRQLATSVHALGCAAFYLTSALSGMRASELTELRAGCRQQDDLPGGGQRFRLRTRRIKGEPFGGTDDSWVVLHDVYNAIGVVESLTAPAAGDRLFAKASNNSNSQYNALRNWVNGEHGQRLGLDPIPDGPVNPRALRRTLALAIAQRPHGLMAAKVQLKHVSIVSTEGYAARPGGQQAAFVAELAAEENAEHLQLTVAAYHDYQRGVLPTGRGARDLVASFHAVEEILARHEAGPATVVDDRRVEGLLRATSRTLHVGVANYCWFTDPGKALCLQLAGTPEAEQPLIGMCDSARCPQATHHPQHRAAWAAHAQHTEAVFLGNPRLSKPERARAQAVVDRATRIVAEIDAATGPPEGPVHGC
jgi:hypothetical protein